MSFTRGLLITGTDTGVGKTFVGSALAAALSTRLRVAVFKPAETGCPERDGILHPEDAARLRDAAGSDESLGLICPYRYREPLAPWVAAEREGRPIAPDRLRRCFAELSTRADVVVVETAGGLLVPLSRTFGFADLAADLDLPLVLVVGSRLGALNQTLLTLECARRRGLVVRGYVLNELSADADLARETNAGALDGLTDVPRLATIRFIDEAARLSRDALARIGEPIARGLLPP